jgi:butyryl-CoA dehydrogenase
MARSDIGKANSESCPYLFFPADTPGFSIGTIEDKMGHRASTNGELIFDDVRLHKDRMLGKEGGAFETRDTIQDTNGVGTGS